MAVHATSKRNIYQSVTSKILEHIQGGPGWFKAPWHVPGDITGMLPTNASTHAEYRGINILTLWIDAQMRGYGSRLWASYQQWQKLGAQVRKGEKGSVVVFYRRIENEASEPEDHDQASKLRFVVRASHVFNRQQVDGFEEAGDPPRSFDPIAEVDAFVQAVKASVLHGFARAQYCHATDAIEMPDPQWFVDSQTSTARENYYAVLLHELTHWSGAPKRLNRTFGKRFGDEAYAFEELVAELGAAFMCAGFGISNEPRPDHAAYVSSWLQVLREDPQAIFTAASKAQEAFEYLAHLATRTEE